MGLMVWVFSWIGLLGFICPLYGTLGRSKFEFVQDLPSLYQPARYQRVPTRSYGNPVSYSVQYVALTRLTYDKGQYSWHSPVGGLTVTTPMARSDFYSTRPNPRKGKVDIA